MSKFMRTGSTLVSVLALSLATLSAPALAEDAVVSISVGLDYSTGDYGEDADTSILFIPITGKVEKGPWTFKAVVPWVQIDGPGSLVGDGEIIGEGEDSKENGLGDVTLSTSYLFFPSQKGRPFFEVTGKVKLATADEEKGLGSGETDFTLLGDVFQPVGDNTTLFATAGYRWRGDPEGLELEDGYLGTIGVSQKFSDRVSGGVMLDYRQSASLTGDDPLELTPFVSWKNASKDWSINLYSTFGFSDGSPNNGVGMSIKRTM